MLIIVRCQCLMRSVSKLVSLLAPLITLIPLECIDFTAIYFNPGVSGP